jgi:creatinine amidohydrolase/Fe(II)-dependent formamide hydrolase-like protein
VAGREARARRSAAGRIGAPISTLANIAVALVWDKARGLRTFGLTPEFAAASKILWVQALPGAIALALVLLAGLAHAQPGSVFIEDLTSPEVKSAIASGKTTAIYYAGSTEQNGPHMALGKHNFVARYVAGRIAEKLGNALVYPVLPFAPTGGHMKFPGTVNLSDKTFGAVAQEVAQSAIAAGFKHVVLMGDHGGGQDALRQVASALDGKGARVHYIGDAYFKSQAEHAGIEDTSELMYLDRDGKWIRSDKPGSRQASAERGKRLLDAKVDNAVAQIRALVGK